MQVISQVFSTGMTSVAIIDAEEGAFRPVLVLPIVWLDNIQNDGHSIFIVSSNQTLVGIGCICSDYPISL